jgi:hypothetical protein
MHCRLVFVERIPYADISLLRFAGNALVLFGAGLAPVFAAVTDEMSFAASGASTPGYFLIGVRLQKKILGPAFTTSETEFADFV